MGEVASALDSEVGPPGEQRVDVVRAQLEQLGVTQRADARRARLAGEDGELADQLAAPDDPRAGVVAAADLGDEPPAAHEEQRVTGVALLEELLARGDADQPAVLLDGLAETHPMIQSTGPSPGKPSAIAVAPVRSHSRPAM